MSGLPPSGSFPNVSSGPRGGRLTSRLARPPLRDSIPARVQRIWPPVATVLPTACRCRIVSHINRAYPGPHVSPPHDTVESVLTQPARVGQGRLTQPPRQHPEPAWQSNLNGKGRSACCGVGQRARDEVGKAAEVVVVDFELLS